MGAWGTGLFEDDTACDLLYQVMETEVRTFILSVIEIEVDHDDWLGDRDASQYIVAGAILDTLIHGNSYECRIKGFTEWLANQSSDSVLEFMPAVIRGLKYTLSKKSELNLMWQENEQEYPVWKSNIETIITSLKQ